MAFCGVLLPHATAVPCLESCEGHRFLRVLTLLALLESNLKSAWSFAAR